MLSISIIGCLFGVVRGTGFQQALLPYHQVAGQNIIIRGVASTDAVYADKGQISFDVTAVTIESDGTPQSINRTVPGTVGVKGYSESMIYRDDVVQAQAKLYPARGSRQARLSFAKIKRVHSDTSAFNKLRRRVVTGMLSSLPEPHASLALGIVIGQRTTLPENLNQDLSVTALTHIVAVSGYNLTIIVNAVRALLKKRSKYQTTVVTIVLIAGFLLVTGLSASIVRAGLVSFFSVWAWYFGRSFRPLLLLALVACITAGANPSYIWSDLGWHLSFLAFFGVLVVAPLFQARFLRAKPKLLLQLCIETSAAQIMTLPIILFAFGRLSLIALPANIAVVPLVPLAMGLTTLAALFGAVVPALATWVAWPGTMVMTYLVDVIRLLAQIPWASVGMQIAWWQMLVLYAAVLLTVGMWWRKVSKNGKIIPIL